MAFNLQGFRDSMAYDGARPNLFEVTFNFPQVAAGGIPLTSRVGTDGLSIAQQMSFFCRTAQLPGSTVNPVPVSYFGREIKLPGNRTFPEWTVTLLNDEDFLVRNAFELWMNGLNSHRGNLRNPSFVNSRGYSVNGTVTQFAKTGEAVKSYTLIGAFPIDITAIDVDWAANDTVEEYAITIAYQWWESQPNTSSTGGTPPTRNIPIF